MPSPLPLVITMGDPAGVGPEVLARLLALQPAGPESGRPRLIIGPAWALTMGARSAGVQLPLLEQVEQPEQLRGPWGLLAVGTEPTDFRVGEVQAACGALAMTAVEQAAALCLAGRAAGMVTCPINKAALHAAGFVDDIGHQEILARVAGATATATMLMTPGLRVVHLSTHKSLIEAARFVTCDQVLARLHLIQRSFSSWGLAEPRIAVAALNPHGGESGLLGREEIEEVGPAVAAACASGLRVRGPIPADSVFNRAINGEFDVVLALYHDQGHIAVKVHNFHESTTATLGLPFVRTSVDHGTAFDIAGRGLADPRSLVAATAAAEALLRGELARL